MSNLGVMTAVTVVVATSESNVLISRGTFTMRPLIAGFILGLFLFALDSANEQVSKVFITLIIITALLVNGEPLLRLLTNAPKTARG